MKKCLFLLFLAPLFAQAQADADITGDYHGHIAIPSMQLKIVMHLNEDDRKLTGTMDIPDQGAKGLKLEQVKLKDGELSFSLPEVPGNAAFNGKWVPATDSISGNFTQGGMRFKLRTKKESAKEKEKTQLSQFAKVQKIEAYIDSLLRKGRMAGCSVGVIKDGEIIINRGFGYRDYEKKIKCDQNTLFAIGSCTKAFTTAVLATLNDEGLFDWEKPVKSYVPYFGMKDKFADEQINGIDICTHRSGLPRHDMVWYGSALDRKALVERIKYMEPNKPFRTTWQYNNFMFMTAGVVAEEITHDKWENLVQKRIFDQLGMKSSRIHFEDFTAAENKSTGYEEKDKAVKKVDYRNIDPMGPAGSIFSTSTDMLQWVKLLLNKGKINDQQVISESQVNFLLEPKVVMNEAGEEFKQSAYAMGWIVCQYKGKTMIEHGGNIDGFTAEVTMFPEEKLGIVVLSNKDGSGIPPLAALYIADRLMDEDEYDWYEEKIGKHKRMAEAAEAAEKTGQKKEEKTKPAAAKKPVAKKGPLHELKQYAGEYNDPAYGTVTVSWKNNELVGTFNALELKLEHEMFETFKAKYEEQDLKMVFFTNASGKIEWMQMQLDALAGPVTFHKKVPDYLKDKTYMDRILGKYDIGGTEMTLVMDKNKFMTKLSDGQEYELVPSGDNLFKLKGVEGFNMEMVFDEKGNCIKVISHQPNGDFEALRKK